MILYIDTTQRDSVTFALDGGRAKKFKITPSDNYTTLALLEKFLAGAKVKAPAIKKILVHPGPGSFNGVRTGLSLAQALGLAWNVPVIPAAGIGGSSKAKPQLPTAAKSKRLSKSKKS